MLKYVKIVDENTGLCDVGLGDKSKYYVSIGMELKDVEKGFDNKWYLSSKLESTDYKSRLVQYQKELFEQEFFLTTLGWIKRKVLMKDGSIKDFLSDLLPQIKLGLDLGESITVITYNQPNFSSRLTDDSLLSLQQRKNVDMNFIKECLQQTAKDWEGV